MRLSPTSATRSQGCARIFRVPTGGSSTAAAYPTEFVQALTEAGYLSVLIPEEYGGTGLPLSAAAAVLEEIQHAGCNGGACHAQMYIMGTLLRHGREAQKQHYLPEHRRGRAAPAGLRRHRADQRHRHARRCARPRAREGDALRRQRPEDLDQPRRALRPDAAAGAHHAARPGQRSAPTGLSVLLVDMREALGKGLTIRPIRTMMNHATTEVFFDNLRGAGREPDRRGGQGLPLHPLRHERRAHPDRRRVHRRRALVHREGQRPTPRSARSSAGRSARTRACSSRSPRLRAACEAAELMVRKAARAVRGRASPAAPRPTWPRCWPPRRPGRRPTPACRRTAASASPRSTTSSASSARRGSTRWRRSRPT